MSEKTLILKINDKLFAIKQENSNISTDVTFQQKCINLLNSYRNYYKEVTNNCKCDEKIGNQLKLNDLENQYRSVFYIHTNEKVEQKSQNINSVDVSSKVIENNTNNDFVFGKLIVSGYNHSIE